MTGKEKPMRLAELIAAGTLLVENEQPDYADVVLGPGDDLAYVALAYVHTERVVLSTDLDADTQETVDRWFAYDVSDSVPGCKVGRQVAGYATRDEAVMALAEAFSEELSAARFAV